MDRFELKAQLDHLNIPYPLDVTTPELEVLAKEAGDFQWLKPADWAVKPEETVA
jgi:hypothetical protein